MVSEISKCPWDEIAAFSSASEYARFVTWLRLQISLGDAEFVPTRSPYFSSNVLQERWVLHRSTGQIWRVIAPDFPFAGLFRAVAPNAPQLTTDN